MKSFAPYFRAFVLCAVALVCSFAVQAQTTALTYQGQLSDGATVANGTYQMQFSLFDAATGGTQAGTTITNTNVTVLNGIFTVQLDFTTGTPFAAGATRYLQIAVKKPADASYTPLTPRQQITSSPYSIRTINAGTSDALSAACAGCVTDGQIAAVSGSKITGTVANATNAASATNAGNVTGTVAVANGGTGATNAPAARSNLGLGTLATVTPTGTANNTTFLRGDNTYAAISAGSSVGTFLLGRSTSNSNATAPAYLNIVGQSAVFLSTQANLPTSVEVVMPAAGTAAALQIDTGGPAPPTFSVTYTLYKNNAATTLSCTIASGANACTSSGAVAVAAGDHLLIRVDGFTGTLPSSANFLILSGVQIK